MRRPIWFKDDYFPMGDKRIDMDPTVVKLPSRMMPLTWEFHHNVESLLGHVDAIRLEDGEITGEFNLVDDPRGRAVVDMLEHGDVRLGGYYTEVEKSKDGNQVLSARLRSVSVTMNNFGNPKIKGT